VEYSAVEDGHNYARDVERRHRGEDEEVGVVEGAERGVLPPTLGVVDAEDDRRRYGN